MAGVIPSPPSSQLAPAIFIHATSGDSVDRRHDKAHSSLMSQPQRTDLANDNGEPEDHLAAATAALFASLKDLDASIEVLASKIKAPAEGASQLWPTR
ncbi:hypothetical protein [Mesorhizobium sp. NZP2077]|uniref:hypothetical protein n=1 Tax=Mesorhizobium sp. NZP2077 TaxID=2483404 RepID=UPI001555CB51|nr:hypothetical protein [Mesorhizobium sp. NZP2077]QKD17140.1 hypothetical protein HGP13_20000 [Mesorhizobium sp. NZP2077]